ncbi:MAG: hypothetical protein VW362_11310 [Candidatus Nanopelagicales bacterium]|jgi:hypothetical protein
MASQIARIPRPTAARPRAIGPGPLRDLVVRGLVRGFVVRELDLAEVGLVDRDGLGFDTERVGTDERDEEDFGAREALLDGVRRVPPLRVEEVPVLRDAREGALVRLAMLRDYPCAP